MNEQQCKHRWEPTEFGKRWWEPGTWQHTCSRCGEVRMCRIGVDDAKNVDEGVPGGESDAAT